MRIILSSTVLFAVSCTNSWEVVEKEDATIFEGDCWPGTANPVPPEGALDYGLTASDIGVGKEDLPYDGIDANCDGADDFDQDGDGFVPAQFVGIATLGRSQTGSLPGGDCWD